MNTIQICPHCGKENKVAGLHHSTKSQGLPDYSIICGHCGGKFEAREGEKHCYEDVVTSVNIGRESILKNE